MNLFYLAFILTLVLFSNVIQYSFCYNNCNIEPYLTHFRLNVSYNNAHWVLPDYNLETDVDNSSSFEKLVPFQVTFDRLVRMLQNQKQEKLIANDTATSLAEYESSMDELQYQCQPGIRVYFVLVNLLHFVAFIIIMLSTRVPEGDRFHNLAVHTYLLLARVNTRCRANLMLINMVQKWITYTLMLWLACAVINSFWLASSSVHNTWLLGNESADMDIKFRILLIFACTFHDMISIMVVMLYLLNCSMNVAFLNANRLALRQKRIDFQVSSIVQTIHALIVFLFQQQFAKNTEEAKINIEFLNEKIALALSILILSFVARLIANSIDIMTHYAQLTPYTLGLFLVSPTLCFALIIACLVQAARVSTSCSAMRHIGHELRARPFCYQQANYHDLDSLLNYTNSLQLKARIMMIPVRGSCVALLLVVFVICLLFVAQLAIHY